MRFLVLLAVSFVGLVLADEINDFIITDECFPEQLTTVVSDNDIYEIVMPQNRLMNYASHRLMLFFMTAAYNENGERIEKGIYVRIDFTLTKLLEFGRDITIPSGDNSLEAYFATANGIYSYNVTINKAEKYGNITEDIISIVKLNYDDTLHILTKDNVIYKITDDGTKKEKIAVVDNAQQIAMDYQHNLYCATDKDVYKYTTDGIVKKIEGLPIQWNYIKILRPLATFNNGVKLVIDKDLYTAYVNETTTRAYLKFQTRPTAISTEGMFLHYYAWNKKMYEYNMIGLMFTGMIDVKIASKVVILMNLLNK